jgi:hypothetical protein
MSLLRVTRRTQRIPLELRGLKLTLESRAVTLELPGARVVWSSPSTVLVDEGTRVRRLPLVDVTGLVEASCVLAAASTTLVAWLAARTRRGAHS